MKDKIIKRCLFGIPTGISIGYLITIISSYIFGNGKYYPTPPLLINQFGSEVSAIIVQTIFMALVGIVFAGCSVIWLFDNWSIAKQTGVYFFIVSLVMFPIAYSLHWMEHSANGFIIYFLVYIIVFILLWFIQYSFWKSNLDKINSRLNNK